MNKNEHKKTSKFLSLILRHRPETVGVELSDAGWIDVDTLLSALAGYHRPLTREQLETVVRENDKQRFVFSDDGRQIRANQGHTIKVDLEYEAAEPPEILLHGTPEQFVDAIRQGGLKKMKRHHVHLHADPTVASAVGQRRGKAVILTILSGDMHRLGHEFLVTPNQVWLIDSVPAEFIDFPE